MMGGAGIRLHPFLFLKREKLGLAERFAQDHGSRDGDIQRAPLRKHWDKEPGIGCIVNGLRCAGRLPAEHDDVGA